MAARGALVTSIQRCAWSLLEITEGTFGSLGKLCTYSCILQIGTFGSYFLQSGTFGIFLKTERGNFGRGVRLDRGFVWYFYGEVRLGLFYKRGTYLVFSTES